METSVCCSWTLDPFIYSNELATVQLQYCFRAGICALLNLKLEVADYLKI